MNNYPVFRSIPAYLLSLGIITGFLAAGPATINWTGGIKVDSDPCLPPTNVEIIFDERKIIAIDSERGQVARALEGELVKNSTTCGNIAVVLSERNINFYSAHDGAWRSIPIRNSDQMIGTSQSFNYSLGQNHAVFSTLLEAHFFDGKTGKVTTISLSGERLRGTVAYDNMACVITDRRVHCAQNTQETVKTYSLNDMHIRSARGIAGKIIMQAPEKTLIFSGARNAFEFIPAR